MEWRESNGVRWLQAELGEGAKAAFSTRLGGVSEPPFDSLNLGILTEDEPDRVIENRRRLAAALGHDLDRVVFALQVHGARLIDHRGAPSSCEVQRADGHLVEEAGTVPLVFVADCLPVALRGPGGVAMVHAGWRGLAGGIVAAAAAAVEATSAAVGPGIGPCCYEVGEEVLGAFAGLGDGVAQGRMLDLPEVARRLLAEAGVGRVESSGLCTSCEGELFFSHRRDRGRTGRQAGLAWIEEG
jgi:purine-nucleoside/S-methyl-5'-thioadenosine phosphorylase / adenosine deaminase